MAEAKSAADKYEVVAEAGTMPTSNVVPGPGQTAYDLLRGEGEQPPASLAGQEPGKPVQTVKAEAKAPAKK